MVCHVYKIQQTIKFLAVLPNQIKEVIQYFPTHNIKLKLLPSLRKGQYHLFSYILFNKVGLFPYITGGSVITCATCISPVFVGLGLQKRGGAFACTVLIGRCSYPPFIFYQIFRLYLIANVCRQSSLLYNLFTVCSVLLYTSEKT